MGLIERENVGAEQQVSAAAADAAFLNLTVGDYAAAWLWLKQAGEKDDPAVLFNKALCELEAGRTEIARDSLLTAQRKLRSPAGFFKEISGIGLELLKHLDSENGPYLPIEARTAEQYPAYAAFRIQWLYILILLRCGRREEALTALAKLPGSWKPESLNRLLRQTENKEPEEPALTESQEVE